MPRTNNTRSRRWVFTYNDNETTPIDDFEDAIKSFGVHSTEYCTFGREVAPTTNRRHLQGFFILGNARSFSSLRRLLGDLIHLERAGGTSVQARDYCHKDGDFWEHGTFPDSQGKRTDLQKYQDWLRTLEFQPSSNEIIELFPSLWLRYSGKLLDLARVFAPQTPISDNGEPYEGWQADLVQELEDPADNRKIKFIVDNEGNKGKSWLCAYLLCKVPSVQLFNCGKEADMAYALDETKRIYIFDCPRSKMEFMQYSFLEMLKNKVVFSGKYNSQTKFLRYRPHVVVFCNEEPDYTKLSEDRMDVIMI